MKKLIALLMAVAMCFCFASCGKNKDSSNKGEKVTLKVWGAQDDQKVLKTMIESFKKANPDTEYDISLGVVGEDDAQARLLEDAAAAADVFSFPDDQIYDLVKAGALYEITRNKDEITSRNTASSVSAATIDGAGFWQKLFHITLPLLKPAINVTVVLNTIYVFNSFTIIHTITNGAPANQSGTIMTYMYYLAFSREKSGAAAALSVLGFVVLLTFAVIYMKTQMKEEQ